MLHQHPADKPVMDSTVQTRAAQPRRHALLRVFFAAIIAFVRESAAQTTLAPGSSLLPSTSCPPATYQLGSSTFTVPCALTVSYTLSTTPSALSATTPVWRGVNSGRVPIDQ